MTPTELWKKIQDPTTENPYALLDDVRHNIVHSPEKAEVSFGTSGWRGELGIEFTLKNIQVVAKAIIKMYKEADAELLKVLGISGFEQLQREGLLIGHDNRLMGKELCEVVASVFEAEGIKVLYGGEASTPEFSAGVEMFDTACAVNMTPSHNPASYAGIKFNPKDGGPAGSEITQVITSLSNELMQTHRFEDLGKPSWTKVDVLTAYKEFLVKRGTIDFSAIQDLIASKKIDLVFDYVHASTRGRPAAILGNPDCITHLRTEDDYLFGGIAPEPSSKNMTGIKEVLAKSTAEFKLGAIFDPDGDRIRYYDGEVEVDMNRFGAIALHYMYKHKGLNGVLAKSVATSNFANAIANGLGIEVVETAVGFKNFRPVLTPGAEPMALIAFEESDGISGFNNTIEKDAQFGLMLCLEMIAKTGKNLGVYLKELQEEYGLFYPERAGFEVEKSMAGAPLMAKVKALGEKVAVGQNVKIGSIDKEISEIITLDGVKIIFADNSWMLVRPSGTEPKVRIYTECRVETEKAAMFEAAKDLFYSV